MMANLPQTWPGISEESHAIFCWILALQATHSMTWTTFLVKSNSFSDLIKTATKFWKGTTTAQIFWSSGCFLAIRTASKFSAVTRTAGLKSRPFGYFAWTYLQPHYGNVYLSARHHWDVNIAGTPLPWW